ncbi:MAG: VWA domain-containing protein [Lachnospiraceae bacterium]|nr:VWA domain-containing protein [Lachnospiraceae bacterium]
MKKQIIATLLGITVTLTTLSGCGLFGEKNGSAAAESPAYIEPSYSESTAESGYADTEYEAYAYEEPAWEEAGGSYSKNTAEECYATYDAAEDTLCPGVYYGYDTPMSGETYRTTEENIFQSALTSPLSTFAADVDTASYANLRRMINDGYDLFDIPQGAIRTEELINYFDYGYKAPGRGDMFAVNASIIDCPWNEETKLVQLGIKAKEVRNTEDIPSNIVFLIDTSGSMSDYDKLPLLQMGFDVLIDDLDENDRVSIVTYASNSSVVIAGVPGDEHSKIKRAVNKLEASGSTNGGEGIKTAYKLAEKYFIEGGNNRVIMATDGDLNVGITSEDELEELISKKKEGGVFLSVLGFGTGNYNEAALETLADKGNGNYSYIDGLTEAKKVLVDEFNSTLFTVAKDVKFQIEFNPKYVSEYRQIGYENRQMAARDFNDDTKDGGEIGSGHEVTVMYEIKMNEGRNDDSEGLRYQNANLSELAKDSDEWMMVSLRYKEPDEDESKLMTFPISKECYTSRPNCDTLFAAYVAECGMILNGSEFTDDASMRKLSKQVASLTLDDEYKEEFAQLIRQL